MAAPGECVVLLRPGELRSPRWDKAACAELLLAPRLLLVAGPAPAQGLCGLPLPRVHGQRRRLLGCVLEQPLREARKVLGRQQRVDDDEAVVLQPVERGLQDQLLRVDAPPRLGIGGAVVPLGLGVEEALDLEPRAGPAHALLTSRPAGAGLQ